MFYFRFYIPDILLLLAYEVCIVTCIELYVRYAKDTHKYCLQSSVIDFGFLISASDNVDLKDLM
jgi:hypothetical protein